VSSLLPPRVKDWKRGQYQIGVCLRTREGGFIELSNCKANEDQAAFVIALLGELTKVPVNVIADVRKAIEGNVGPLTSVDPLGARGSLASSIVREGATRGVSRKTKEIP
jgi:hypothetical protein